MGRRHSFGFSFSWKRALGISAAKGRLSRQLGIPLTRSGRQRKLGRMLVGGGCLLLVAALSSTTGVVLLFLWFLSSRIHY